MHEETTEEWQAAERVSKDPLREWYTKEIWGKRAPDDDALFEVMSLQVFQAGLTWRMVLSRRDSFRSALPVGRSKPWRPWDRPMWSG